MRIDSADENRDCVLTPITKISKKIINEFPSMIPGEPAVHLNAFIQTIIQRIKTKSPGKTKDCCNPNMEKFQVYASNGRLIIERLVRLMMEKARIVAAIA